ncbi:LysR family transcriptional regulator [Roseobacter sp. EG26]|uniref:LysR family transcriptional regulator n=1 Tax=Roseobacter sp. EG26 TaxID=3412477 RepID=UPI003CE56070
MPIKIEMLRCFSHVAQAGNLAEAASRMGRTQSAVSMTLKQLEDHLGQSLFEGERKNQLSPLGQQVFALAQQQVTNFDATVREIETSASSPKGLLRIASIPSAAGRLVPLAVDALITRHSGLKVDMRDTDTAMVIDALVRGQADIGIASGTPALNGIQGRVLFEDRFGLTCAPDHALANCAGSIRLEDVITADFIGNNLCHNIEHETVRQALSETRIQAHNTFSLIGMIKTCKWVTILPRSVVQDLHGDLVFRPIVDLAAKRSVSALVAERSSQHRLATEFAELLQELS